ncbi:putative protein CcmO [Listeria monocytogenes]|nr:putative protein CcmO [Listeria monocytogenes]
MNSTNFPCKNSHKFPTNRSTERHAFQMNSRFFQRFIYCI